MKKLQIAVIGSAGPEEYPGVKPDRKMLIAAKTIGKEIAKKSYITISGGKGGVMEAVCQGAKAAGGFTVAEIAGAKRGQSNTYVDAEVITTDIGFRGPSLLIGMSDAIISLGGGAGTLQELTVAYRMEKPVVLVTGFGGWTDKIAKLDFLDERQLVRFLQTKDPDKSVALALNLIQLEAV